MVGFTAWANATYSLRCKAAVSEKRALITSLYVKLDARGYELTVII